MIKELGPGFRLTLIFTVLTGILYPAVMTAISEVIFPRQANGSLVTVGDKTVGSSLIGQNFSKAEYFHPRPSSAGNGYDATASGGSNLGPTSSKLLGDTRLRIAQYCEENQIPCRSLPADAVTASASGLDPHISPANADLQTARVAKARNVSVDQVKHLIAQYTKSADLGFLGEPRVNVLMLNIALDQQFPL